MGQPRTWTRNDALAVVAFALLLFAVAIPTLAARLDATRSARFTFALPAAEPACVPTGYCFRVAAGSFERSETAYRLPLSIAGVDNVYRLAKEVDEGRLRAVAVGGAEPAPLRIAPAYTTYINVDEVVRHAGAFLEFERHPSGRISVAFEHDGAASKPLALDIHANDIGRLDGILASANPKLTRTARHPDPAHRPGGQRARGARGAAPRRSRRATGIPAPWAAAGAGLGGRDRLAGPASRRGAGNPDAVAGDLRAMAGQQPRRPN